MVFPFVSISSFGLDGRAEPVEGGGGGVPFLARISGVITGTDLLASENGALLIGSLMFSGAGRGGVFETGGAGLLERGLTATLEVPFGGVFNGD